MPDQPAGMSDRVDGWAAVRSRLAGDVEAPAVGDALEVVLAEGFEGEAAACDEVFDGLRDQYLGGACESCDASAGGDCDAPAFPVDEFAFAGVDAGADFDGELADAIADLVGAVDGACRAVE